MKEFKRSLRALVFGASFFFSCGAVLADAPAECNISGAFGEYIVSSDHYPFTIELKNSNRDVFFRYGLGIFIETSEQIKTRYDGLLVFPRFTFSNGLVVNYPQHKIGGHTVYSMAKSGWAVGEESPKNQVWRALYSNNWVTIDLVGMNGETFFSSDEISLNGYKDALVYGQSKHNEMTSKNLDQACVECSLFGCD